ncbi:AAA domain-containing protein [Geothermobacter ehrlichii]|uniref:AAA domain-containing protein n=1 Tax=Geothermobacter ehrlichii TaxID=213224 RepID=A0A5D3WJ91_9BACT|nr:NERD domain-containing protein/DEAD/DEAH box helicase [Geothermobacter ehrlichii]TYO98084.1 AAA domain-containing protein [Geothermobacter ehrlichii]
MRGLWPKEQLRPTDSLAEQKVYAALKKQLPKDWTAWHSLRIRTADGLEGEGDFVLAIPHRGFLVLEVKGGHLEQRDGRWYQNGHLLPKGPREQGLGYARKLHTRLKEAGLLSVPFAVLSIFPDTAFSNPPNQDDISELLLGSQDIPWLIDSIQSKLDKAFPAGFLVPDGNWAGQLHRLWGESWAPRLKLGHKARINAEERLKLDAEQLRLIDCLLGNRRLLVEGVAGSGKTLIAREAALKMAQQGKRVLYLCFTDALAEWLRPTLSNAGVDVFTVPRYAVHLLQKANLIDSPPTTTEFWFNVSLHAAADALPEKEDAPEVIILDEAQDLTENDWVLVEALGLDQTCWIFYDPAQAFWNDRCIPEWTAQGGRFCLTRCYRCPPAVMEYSRKIRQQPYDEERLQKGIKDGTIGFITSKGETTALKELEKEITRLRSEGFAPEDIAILSLRGQTASDGIARVDRIGNTPVVRADDPTMTENIVADTFLRFKGLERPAIIVTDLRLVKDRKDVRMHIALTRATDVVRIVEVKKLRHTL